MNTAPTYTEEELAKAWNKCKGQLFMESGAGFLGSFLCQMPFRWNKNIPTACISISRLQWNPDFFMSLNESTRVTVLAHELGHGILGHNFRRGTRDPEDWNIACDHVVNLMCEEYGYDMTGFPYIMDKKYRGWATEDIYDDIHDPNKPPCQCPQPGTGDGKGGLGNDIDESGDDGSEDGGQGTKPSKEEVFRAVKRIQAAMTAGKMSGLDPGNIPGEVPRMIDKFLTPKLPWNVLLYQYFNAMVDFAHSFARPNRRIKFPIMPSRYGREGLEHLMFYVDASGSVSDSDILRCASEVKHIQETLEPEKLTMAFFDTEIMGEKTFHRGEPFMPLEIEAGGGTSLEPVFEHMKANGATAAIIFSDMYVSIPDDPGIDIIWIATTPHNEPAYGKYILFENDGEAA